MQTRNLSMVTACALCLAALSGAFGIGTLSSQQPEAIQPADGLVCLVVNKNSGRCLSVANAAVESGAKIVQGPTPGQAGASERWRLVAAGEAFRLRNENSGLVLQIWSTNLQQGVQAVQSADQVSKEHQHWTLEPAGDAYVLRAGHSQLVLGVAQSSREEGARVIQWNPIPNLRDQLWVLRSPKDAVDLDVGGQPAPSPREEANSRSPGWMRFALVLGLFVAILLATIVWALMRARGRRQREA